MKRNESVRWPPALCAPNPCPADEAGHTLAPGSPSVPPSLLCPGDRDPSVRTELPGPGAGVRPQLHSGSSVTGAGAVASAATHPELAAHVPWPWAPQASAAGLRLHPGQAPGVLTRAEAQAAAV